MVSASPSGAPDAAWRRGASPPRVGPDRARSLFPLVAWMLALVAAVWLFTWVAGGALDTPPITDPASLPAWMVDRPPAEVAFAILRMVVLALAWYLLGTTTVGVVARVVRAARLVAIADVLTVPAVRRLLQAALGAGLAVAAVSSVPVPSLTQAPAQVTAEEDRTASALEDGAAAGSTNDPGGAVSTDAPPTDLEGAGRESAGRGSAGREGAAPELTVPEMTGSETPPPRVPADAPGRFLADEATPNLAGSGDPRVDRSLEPPGGEPDPVEEHGQTGVESGSNEAGADADALPGEVIGDANLDEELQRWRVARGEHLWAIAEAALSSAWDEAPSDGQVHDYWTRLIEENRSRLPDPTNPDLIYPGLELDLPQLPTSRG